MLKVESHKYDNGNTQQYADSDGCQFSTSKEKKQKKKQTNYASQLKFSPLRLCFVYRVTWSLCFQWLSSKSLPSREAGCVTMTISSCSTKVLYLTSHPMRGWQQKHLQETSQTTTGLVNVNSDSLFIDKVTKLWTCLTDMTHWWNLIGVCIFLKCYHFSFVYNSRQHYHYYSKYLWKKNRNAVFFLSILPSTLKNTLP